MPLALLRRLSYISMPINRTGFASHKGFTLVELLVVISIIALLGSIVFTALNSARARSRDARRVADIRQIQLALEMYYDTNGSYPAAAPWTGGTGNCWGTVTDNYIPGLAPAYIPTLPLDPKPTNCGSVYLYGSTGTDYKIMAHVPENCENPAMRTLKDPLRDSGPNPAIVDGNSCWAWSIYTPNVAAW